MRFQNVFHSPIDGTLETYSADFELIEQDRKAPRFSATVHTPVLGKILCPVRDQFQGCRDWPHAHGAAHYFLLPAVHPQLEYRNHYMGNYQKSQSPQKIPIDYPNPIP